MNDAIISLLQEIWPKIASWPSTYNNSFNLRECWCFSCSEVVIMSLQHMVELDPSVSGHNIDTSYVGASSKKGSLGTVSENSCFDGIRQYMI